ncbi:M14 family metallopeptidase [Gelidibacter mesophilus]|uniref:M14 family metallopeptidase n=1 Tax=Gelidibacter mesophilus TaxID=169050 RepID=UPI00042A751D|nr:M14 family metallopeptidase [Gelidibacter mesophilus]
MLKLKNIVSIAILILVISSCNQSKSKKDVVFDALFEGARLDSVIPLDNNSFLLKINPAFEPVNDSPYYAFSLTSETAQTIEVLLDYGAYKHRYIPKLSYDKHVWKKISKNNIRFDTVNNKTVLKLDVSSKKLYVSAQEIETSQDTYRWVDSIINDKPEIKKSIAGTTVLKHSNYVMQYETPEVKKAIVLIARQHPPEIPGGSIGFKAFYEELVASNEIAHRFRQHYNIYAFPLLNPDGADLGNWRHNANGVDLNRDWVEFEQPETQMVKTFLVNKYNNGNSIEFAIDFHTSYSGPYLLVLDSINNVKSKGIIDKWIENIETNSSFKVEARPRSQELPYCYNYFYNTYGCEAVTYEEGDEIDRDIIKQRARLYAQQFMETMILKIKINEI